MPQSEIPAMSHGRRQAFKSARGKVLQRLFAYEYEPHPVDDSAMRTILRWETGDPLADAFEDRLYAEVLFRRPALDEHIREFSKGWSLERMTRIDRNILRMGLCEILHDPGLPFRVSVHEALELVHQFSEPEAVAFVNGILHEAAVQLAPEKGPYNPVASGKRTDRPLGQSLRGSQPGPGR